MMDFFAQVGLILKKEVDEEFKEFVNKEGIKAFEMVSKVEDIDGATFYKWVIPYIDLRQGDENFAELEKMINLLEELNDEDYNCKWLFGEQVDDNMRGLFEGKKYIKEFRDLVLDE